MYTVYRIAMNLIEKTEAIYYDFQLYIFQFLTVSSEDPCTIFIVGTPILWI